MHSTDYSKGKYTYESLNSCPISRTEEMKNKVPFAQLLDFKDWKRQQKEKLLYAMRGHNWGKAGQECTCSVVHKRLAEGWLYPIPLKTK